MIYLNSPIEKLNHMNIFENEELIQCFILYWAIFYSLVHVIVCLGTPIRYIFCKLIQYKFFIIFKVLFNFFKFIFFSYILLQYLVDLIFQINQFYIRVLESLIIIECTNTFYLSNKLFIPFYPHWWTNNIRFLACLLCCVCFLKWFKFYIR